MILILEGFKVGKTMVNYSRMLIKADFRPFKDATK